MTSTRPVVDETAALAGAAAPRTGEYLVCIEGDRSWTVNVPATGELVIGRDPHAGLTLTDAQVSRTHAQLLLVPDGLRLTDLGSRHGTLVNGDPLAGSRLLGSGRSPGL